MMSYGLTQIQTSAPSKFKHQFGNSGDPMMAIFSARLLFSVQDVKKGRLEFALKADVIHGDHPLLLGLPSLRAMKAKINCESGTLEISINGKERKIQLQNDGNHLFLPCQKFRKCSTKPSYASVVAGKSLHTGAAQPGGETESYYSPSNTGVPPTGTYNLSSGLSYSSLQYKESFDLRDLRRIHINTGHSSISDMVKWLKRANVWRPEMKASLIELVKDCTCALSGDRVPHPVVSMGDTEGGKLETVTIDVTYFYGVPFFHVMDKKLKWSELKILTNRSMETQISALKHIWLYRYGVPKVIQADPEYDNETIKSFCKENGIHLIITAAEDHGQQGAIEVANKILKSFFKRIQSSLTNPSKFDLADAVAQACYAKNISFGSKLASSYELLFSVTPRIVPGTESKLVPPCTLEAFFSHQAKLKMLKASQAAPRNFKSIGVGDFVMFRREKDGWLGPARVVQVQGNIISFLHNERTKTAGISAVKKVDPPLEHWINDYNEGFGDPSDSPIASRTRSALASNPSAPNVTVTSSQGSQRTSDSGWTEASSSAVSESDTSHISYPLTDYQFTLDQGFATRDRCMDAYAKEKENWLATDSITVMHRADVPRNTVVLSSHVVYRDTSRMGH